MFTNFFNTAEVDQYADWIVDEVKRVLPPTSELSPKRIAERANEMNERIAKRTVAMTRVTKLNFYKKAHMAARVRERMVEAGYPADFVKSFSYDLLTRLQAATQVSPG